MKTEKQSIEKISEGVFRVKTQNLFNDGSGSWESIDIVFSSEELASNEAQMRKEKWGSNLVCLGNKSMIVQGIEYFYPTFNVFD